MGWSVRGAPSSPRSPMLGLWLGSATLLLSLALPMTALGHHSVPNPKWWWDKDNDGVVDATDGDLNYCYAGTLWTTAKKDRAQEATDAWRTTSSWDADIGAAGCGHDIHADGAAPPDGTWAALGQPLAYTQKSYTFRGSYYDMEDSDIYVNINQYPFNVSATCTGSLCSTTYSFRGVVTHEVGHGVRLIHPPTCLTGSQKETMCASVTINESWFIDDLTSDDIASANDVY